MVTLKMVISRAVFCSVILSVCVGDYVGGEDGVEKAGDIRKYDGAIDVNSQIAESVLNTGNKGRLVVGKLGNNGGRNNADYGGRKNDNAGQMEGGGSGVELTGSPSTKTIFVAIPIHKLEANVGLVDREEGVGKRVTGFELKENNGFGRSDGGESERNIYESDGYSNQGNNEKEAFTEIMDGGFENDDFVMGRGQNGGYEERKMDFDRQNFGDRKIGNGGIGGGNEGSGNVAGSEYIGYGNSGGGDRAGNSNMGVGLGKNGLDKSAEAGNREFKNFVREGKGHYNNMGDDFEKDKFRNIASRGNAGFGSMRGGVSKPEIRTINGRRSNGYNNVGREASSNEFNNNLQGKENREVHIIGFRLTHIGNIGNQAGVSGNEGIGGGRRIRNVQGGFSGGSVFRANGNGWTNGRITNGNGENRYRIIRNGDFSLGNRVNVGQGTFIEGNGGGKVAFTVGNAGIEGFADGNVASARGIGNLGTGNGGSGYGTDENGEDNGAGRYAARGHGGFSGRNGEREYEIGGNGGRNVAGKSVFGKENRVNGSGGNGEKRVGEGGIGSGNRNRENGEGFGSVNGESQMGFEGGNGRNGRVKIGFGRKNGYARVRNNRGEERFGNGNRENEYITGVNEGGKIGFRVENGGIIRVGYGMGGNVGVDVKNVGGKDIFVENNGGRHYETREQVDRKIGSVGLNSDENGVFVGGKMGNEGVKRNGKSVYGMEGNNGANRGGEEGIGSENGGNGMFKTMVIDRNEGGKGELGVGNVGIRMEVDRTRKVVFEGGNRRNRLEIRVNGGFQGENRGGRDGFGGENRGIRIEGNEGGKGSFGREGFDYGKGGKMTGSFDEQLFKGRLANSFEMISKSGAHLQLS